MKNLMTSGGLALPLILLLLASGTLHAADEAAQQNRPNVLLICADDHAAYVAGCYGNEAVRTPNIDRLAASGVRFDRAYCNSPVCTASRASFITGRYPRSVGVTRLRTPLPASATTLAEVLRKAGYDTAAMGKMHFNSNLKHGFDRRLDRGTWRKWLRGRDCEPIPDRIETLPKWRPFRDPARVWLNGMYDPYAARDANMYGTYLAGEAASYLKQRGEEPFFLMVSFAEPHSPFRFPIEYRDRHDPSEFDVPRVGPEDLSQIPAEFRNLSDEEKRGIIASYYTSTEFMDKNVGRVLDALERTGHRDDTIVVYIGDHGYMLGQHGRFEKHCSYEPAVRSPLLIRVPGKVEPGGSTDALTEFIDIMPTILDYCGVKTPSGVQGRSLRGVLSGGGGARDEHREHVIVEYAQNDEIMIRDDRWKLVYIRGKRRRTDGYQTGLPLPGPTLKLYDLKRDPEELNNLADRAEHNERIERYLSLLVEHLKRTSRFPEKIPDSSDPMVILEHCVQPRDRDRARAELEGPAPQWIWSSKPAGNDERVLFRKVFTVEWEGDGPPPAARLTATCDNEMTVSLNGEVLARSTAWREPVHVDARRALRKGSNVLTVQARNRDGAAGLLLRLVVEPGKGETRHVVSNESWQAAKRPTSGGSDPDSEARHWKQAVSWGKLGTQPWAWVNFAQANEGMAK